MPGGITDANMNRVVTMRQSNTAWGQIAGNLKVNITDVVSKLSSIENDAHKNIKETLAESIASGRAAGGLDDSVGETEEMPGEGAGGGGEDLSGEATGGTGTVGDFPEGAIDGGSREGGSVDGHGSGGY
jgi:hypothetical protein